MHTVHPQMIGVIIYLYTYINIDIDICVCVCVCICIYTYIHVYIYIYIYIGLTRVNPQMIGADALSFKPKITHRICLISEQN